MQKPSSTFCTSVISTTTQLSLVCIHLYGFGHHHHHHHHHHHQQGGHKPGILWEFSEMEHSGNSEGILCNLREKLQQTKVFLVRHSNICVQQLVTCYIAGVDVE